MSTCTGVPQRFSEARVVVPVGLLIKTEMFPCRLGVGVTAAHEESEGDSEQVSAFARTRRPFLPKTF